jgi:DNA-binding MarR family transcriptional regulator
MPAKSQLPEIEKREGRPMAAILMELYERHESQTAVARVLGVPQPTLSQWIKKLGLREKVTLVPTNPPKQS